MKKQTHSMLQAVLIARFLCQRLGPRPLVTGYMYSAPRIACDFLQAFEGFNVPGQQLLAPARLVGRNTHMFFFMPNELREYTLDLAPGLKGETYDTFQVEDWYKIEQPTAGQSWLQINQIKNLGDLFRENRNTFEEWVDKIYMTNARCNAMSSEEMKEITSCIGEGRWQQVLPVDFGCSIGD